MSSSPRAAMWSKLVSRASMSRFMIVLSLGLSQDTSLPTATVTSAGRGPPSRWRSGDEDVAVFRHRLAAEERQYGEYAPVVVLAVRKAELLEDGLHMAFDRARAEVDLLGD